MTQPAHDKYDPNCPHERTHRDAGGAEICTDCRNIVLKPTHDDKPTAKVRVGKIVPRKPQTLDDGYLLADPHDDKPLIADVVSSSHAEPDASGDVDIEVDPHDDTTEPMTVEQVLDDHAAYYIRRTIAYLKEGADDPRHVTGLNAQDKRAIAAINALVEQRVDEALRRHIK